MQPGYIGYDQGGQLTEAVRRKPYSVVLFDEIEKAHPDVWNVLLQVLEDGRLTDSQGRTVSFSNTIIIMTSNLGSEILLREIDQKTGELKESAKAQVIELVKRHFRPEFLNRLDDMIVFSPLSKHNLHKIVGALTGSLVQRLKARDIDLTISEAAINYCLQHSFDPQYGARPLRRFVEQVIGTQLGRMILQGSLPDHSNAVLTTKDGELHVKVESKLASNKKLS